jgi:hypothetical protein
MCVSPWGEPPPSCTVEGCGVPGRAEWGLSKPARALLYKQQAFQRAAGADQREMEPIGVHRNHPHAGETERSDSPSHFPSAPI